jgi:hypothetical protein
MFVIDVGLRSSIGDDHHDAIVQSLHQSFECNVRISLDTAGRREDIVLELPVPSVDIRDIPARCRRGQGICLGCYRSRSWVGQEIGCSALEIHWRT